MRTTPPCRGWEARATSWRGLVGALLLGACGGSAEPTPPPPPPPPPARIPTTIAIVQGDSQHSRIFTTLPIPIVIVASDGRGPIPGASLRFELGADDDEFSPSSTTTDSTGRITATWKIGKHGGTRLVAIYSKGSGGDITAFVQGGAPVGAIVSAATAGPAGGPMLVWGAAVDQYGNRVSGVPFTFVIDSGAGHFVHQTYLDTTTIFMEVVGDWQLGDTARRNVGHVVAGGFASLPVAAVGLTAGLVPIAGDSQRARPGKAVPGPIVVQASNVSGGHLGAGLPVHFMVVSHDGGVITNDSALTDATGQARDPAPWILDPTPGWNTMIVTGEAGVEHRLYAEGILPKPERIEVVSGRQQAGWIGNLPPARPEVVVYDSSGVPMPDQPIAVRLLSSIGAVRPFTSQRTDAQGRARISGWRLTGGTGTSTIEVSTPNLPPAPVTAAATVGPPPAGSFDITVRFRGLVPTWLPSAVRDQTPKWETILADLPDVPVNLPSDPGGCHPAIAETIDDIVVYFEVGTVNGHGAPFAAVTVCEFRPGTNVPLVSLVTLDRDDLTDLDANGLVPNLILHEIGHALGVGSAWNRAGLVDLLRGQYTGDAGVAAGNWERWWPGQALEPSPWVVAGGPDPTGLDNQSHWARAVPDIMAGAFGTRAEIGLVSAGSLRDLGYLVDDSKATELYLPDAIRSLNRTGVGGRHSDLRSTAPRR